MLGQELQAMMINLVRQSDPPPNDSLLLNGGVKMGEQNVVGATRSMTEKSQDEVHEYVSVWQSVSQDGTCLALWSRRSARHLEHLNDGRRLCSCTSIHDLCYHPSSKRLLEACTQLLQCKR